MRKIICFSVFGASNVTPENEFEFNAYLRGFYFNVRFAKILYPDWEVHVEIDSRTFSLYDNIFTGLKQYYGITLTINEMQPLCKSMFWRVKKAFMPDVDYIICRDADALVTYREAQAVKAFVDSGLDVHGITDNLAHGIPLLGGMIGLRCQPLRDKFVLWRVMADQVRDSTWPRGMDQILISDLLYTKENRSKTFGHYLQGYKGDGEAIIKTTIDDISLPGVDPKLWETNLCVRHIGSAGVVELETMRQLRRFTQETEFENIAKRYPKIFYWYAQ